MVLHVCFSEECLSFSGFAIDCIKKTKEESGFCLLSLQLQFVETEIEKIVFCKSLLLTSTKKETLALIFFLSDK